MDAFLERLSADQLIAIIAIIVGGIVLLVFILSITKYQLQSLNDDTALKREKQQAELELRTKMIEHGGVNGANLDALLALDTSPPALDLAPTSADELNAELAKRFGWLKASPEVIEKTLGLVLTLDTPRKKAIKDVVEELYDSGADAQSILAAVRSLCAAPAPKEKSIDLPLSIHGM